MSPPPLDPVSELVAVRSHLYPYGVTEQYPNMVTSAGKVLSNTAHAYAECSNRGYCNRGSGTCECLYGFEGSDCGRMSCPAFNGEVCSGHGVCSSARELANLDNNIKYELWDRHFSHGCQCDAGYYGPDCSLRRCPIGYDPIYAASLSRGSRRYPAWTYTLHVPTATAGISGAYAIDFHDVYGEDWRTRALQHDATCDDVISALEDLPNNAVPEGSVRCVKTEWGAFQDLSPIMLPAATSFYGVKYSVSMTMNPGVLKQISVNRHLDDSRPTLFSTKAGSPMGTFVYPESGVAGETIDHFNDRCFGVLFKLRALTVVSGQWTVLHDLNQIETIRLKRCLHLSGGGKNNAMLTDFFQDEEFQWEAGTAERPHLVRIVPLYGVPEQSSLFQLFAGPRRSVSNESSAGRKPDDSTEYRYDFPGFLAALIYDSESEQFRLYNRFDANTMGGGNLDVQYAIQTTEGELVLSADKVRIVTSSAVKFREVDKLPTVGLYDRYAFGVASNSSRSPYYVLPFVDCETFFADNKAYTKAQQAALRLDVHCIEKGDTVMFFDTTPLRVNPAQLVSYRVDRISRLKRDKKVNIVEIKLNMGMTSNWDEGGTSEARAYIFRPIVSGEGTYTYVAECASRGHCNTETGVCDCFTGYGGVSCSDQSHIIS